MAVAFFEELLVAFIRFVGTHASSDGCHGGKPALNTSNGVVRCTFVIRTDEDHEKALREIEALWGAEDSTEAGDWLDVPARLIEADRGI